MAAPPTPPTSSGERLAVSPTDWRLGVWRLFLQQHNAVIRSLERDLQRETELPLAWYDVLLHLAEADGRRLRMADLAASVLLSRSGLTRLVDRISDAGLVSREPYPGDARGTYCVLTDAGLARLRSAAPVHLAGIRDHWLSRFTDEQLLQLRALLDCLDHDSAAGVSPAAHGD